MNIGVVKDGELSFVGFSSCQCVVCRPSDGRVITDDVHQTLGMFGPYDTLPCLTALPVLMKQLASDTNKSTRACNYYLRAIAGSGDR
jgi:hypothetical protein